VFRKYQAVIFVHGCFWHRHSCPAATMPKTNKTFWRGKFKANHLRDSKSMEELIKSGWRVCVIWECILEDEDRSTKAIGKVENWLRSTRLRIEIPSSTGVDTHAWLS